MSEIQIETIDQIYNKRLKKISIIVGFNNPYSKMLHQRDSRKLKTS